MNLVELHDAELALVKEIAAMTRSATLAAFVQRDEVRPETGHARRVADGRIALIAEIYALAGEPLADLEAAITAYLDCSPETVPRAVAMIAAYVVAEYERREDALETSS
jgi:hypothetical protein